MNEDYIEDEDNVSLETGLEIEFEEKENQENIEAPVSEDDGKITSFYSFLKDNSYLDVPEDFQFDGTAEKFEEAFLTSKNRIRNTVAENLLGSVSPELRPIIDFAVNGGKSLDDYINSHNVIDYDSVDLSVPEVQVNILRKYYSETTNYTPDKIEKLIARLGEDVEQEAYDAINDLKELQTQKLAAYQTNLKNQELQQQEIQKKERDSISKAIDSSAHFDTDRKGKVKAFIFNTKRVGSSEATDFSRTVENIKSNPLHFSQLADLLMDYSSNDGFSFDRIKRKERSSINKSIKEQLQTINPSIKQSAKPSGTGFNWEEFIEQT